MALTLLLYLFGSPAGCDSLFFFSNDMNTPQLITRAETVQTILIPLAQEHLRERLTLIAGMAGVSPKTLAADFKADKKEIFSFYPSHHAHAERIVLLGMGAIPSPHVLRQTLRLFFHRQRKNLHGTILLDLAQWSDLSGHAIVPQLIEAALIGTRTGLYDIGFLKSKPAQAPDFQFKLLVGDEIWEQAQAALARGMALAQAQLTAMHLTNLPPSHLPVAEMVRQAETIARQSGLHVQVLHQEEIASLGMNGLLGVNRGSQSAPAFIILEHTPPTTTASKPIQVAIVGKGVVFDTGGISIKPADNMHLMKSDMGGAAAVIGVLEAAALLDLPIHVIGLIPTTDNMPDGAAMVPGEVLRMYSGQTVEIIDTDAEGRLILADGLAYALRHYAPDVLIDIATLTGGSIMALGYACAALFSSGDQLADDLYEAGQATEERVWRMPLWDDYAKHIESDVADMKNLGIRPAGVISAAKFLEKFVNGHTAWAHLDIAGPVMPPSEFGMDRVATGFGVRLLVEYLEKKAGKHA